MTSRYRTISDPKITAVSCRLLDDANHRCWQLAHVEVDAIFSMIEYMDFRVVGGGGINQTDARRVVIIQYS